MLLKDEWTRLRVANDVVDLRKMLDCVLNHPLDAVCSLREKFWRYISVLCVTIWTTPRDKKSFREGKACASSIFFLYFSTSHRDLKPENVLLDENENLIKHIDEEPTG
jgi:serine/threonine protein kinase